MSEKEKDLNAPNQENQAKETPSSDANAEATVNTQENQDLSDLSDDLMKTLEEAKKAKAARAALLGEDVETPSTEDSKEEETEDKEAPVLSEASPDSENDDVDEEEPTQPALTEEKDKEEESANIEAKDFAGMTEEEIVKIATELSESEDNHLDRAYQELKKAKDVMASYFEEQKNTAKQAFVDGGGDADGFKYDPSPLNATFFGIFNDIKERRKKYHENITKQREENLKKKKAIIEEVKVLTESDDISKVASRSNTDKVKELQQKWQDIGSVPKADAEELYKSYRALLDMFYDKKRIAFDLQRLDREKNLKIKTGLCERAEDLAKEEVINDAVKKLNTLHEEYKAAGPVPRDKQEELWQRFKKASDVIYDKKRAYAEEYKKQLQENMELKQALCLRAESYISFESDSIKEWNKTTKELLSLQEEWEKIGALPREVAKDINKQFWGNFKQFFANKNKFFEALDAARAENLKKKEALCEKAEALQESTDWDEAANALKDLQADWKKVGPVPQKQKDTIYERFKAACDTFFERRRNRRSEEDKVFQDNLTKKQAICKQIEELAAAPDMEAFDKLKSEFKEIGFVPRNAINDITDQFSNAIEKFFAGTDKDEHDRDKATIETLVDVFQDGAANDRNISRKRQNLRNKINQIEDEIALLENNLTFFSRSKNADKLISEFSSKIDTAKGKLETLKRQYRIFSKMD